MIHIGKTIDEEIAENIKKFTDKNERGDIANQNNCSPSTIREVLYRRSAVSEKSFSIILQLLAIANAKANKEALSIRKFRKSAKEILDCV